MIHRNSNGTEVYLKSHRYDIERACRKFNKKLQKHEILKDAMRNLYYTKPSDRKRLKRKEAMLRRRKEESTQTKIQQANRKSHIKNIMKGEDKND